MNIEQQRARGIRGVGGVNFAAGEPPEQKSIDGAEGELAAGGFVGRARNVGQQPREFCAGEIGIEQKPGLRRDARFIAFVFQPRAEIGGAAVLPDDGAMHGSAGCALPQQRRLALIGDADADNIARCGIGFAQCVPARRDGRRPKIFRIVLDLAVGRKVLGKFLLRDGGNRRVGAKQHGPRRCRALIDGQRVRRQANPPARIL